MKKLADFLSEKLIINKNFKDDDLHDTEIGLSIIKKYIDLKQTRVYAKNDISRVGKFSKSVLNDIDNLFGSSLDLTDYKKLVNICKQFDELDTLYRLHGYDIANNGVCDVIIKISKKIRGNGKNVWANDDDISNKGLNIFRTDDLIIIISLKNSAGWVHIGFNQKDLDDVEPFEEKVDEKLIINKNFSDVKTMNAKVANDIYDKAELITGWMNNVHCAMQSRFKNIINLNYFKSNTGIMPGKLNGTHWDIMIDGLRDIADDDTETCLTHYNHSRITSSEKVEFRRLYNDLMKYIDDNASEINFVIDENVGLDHFQNEYMIRMINTPKGVVCVAGVKKIYKQNFKSQAYVLTTKL